MLLLVSSRMASWMSGLAAGSLAGAGTSALGAAVTGGASLVAGAAGGASSAASSVRAPSSAASSGSEWSFMRSASEWAWFGVIE